MKPKPRLSALATPQPIIAIGREFDDFDELSELIFGWGLDWRQLDCGPFHATLQQVQTPSSLLIRFRFGRKFHQGGTPPAGVRTFAIIGERSPALEWRGTMRPSEDIVVFPADDGFEWVSHPDFHGDAVSVSEDRIRSVAQNLGLPDPLEILPDGQAIMASDPRRVHEIRRRVTKLHMAAANHRNVTRDELTWNKLEFEVVAALVKVFTAGLLTESRSPGPALRNRALRLALEYIEGHADEPPTVEDICRASGASERTLEYAFRDRFGVTPKRYLQATRLQKVRRDLSHSEPNASISEIAATWGFWHMGQFAEDYQRQFGELPSETRRRARLAIQ